MRPLEIIGAMVSTGWPKMTLNYQQTGKSRNHCLNWFNRKSFTILAMCCCNLRTETTAYLRVYLFTFQARLCKRTYVPKKTIKKRSVGAHLRPQRKNVISANDHSSKGTLNYQLPCNCTYVKKGFKLASTNPKHVSPKGQ